jgi:hypothetical protein
MIIWLALLIPFVGVIIAYYLWKEKFVWWELALPTVISFICIAGIKYSVEAVQLHDVEYRGGLITEARYYEYWETWVDKTCSRQVACGTYTTGSGKNKTTHTKYCTKYYDCSYCDKNDPYWMVYDDQGNSWNITEKEYNKLVQQWKATPVFVELNRNIKKHFSCGKDGDMYKIVWNKDMITSEASTKTASYTNHVQASKSSFGLREISKKEAKKFGLYEYPDVDNYRQVSILGLDSAIFLEQKYKNGAQKEFEYFNGVYGPKRKLRVYILMFYGKNLDIAIKQKNYWVGGNKNEVVICIDVDKNTGKLNWVYPFTWGENKRIAIDLREDIMNTGKLNFTSLYNIVDRSTKDFTYRDFHQFDYLSIDPTTGEIWAVYLITLAATIGLIYFGHVNKFEDKV